MSPVTQKIILLVEDEVVQTLMVKINLEKYGYTVLTATSGELAVETVRQKTPIDLILMDIDLGSGIDGTEAAELILQLREIPVVFLSSHTESEIVEKTEKITSYGYVVKNSSFTVLDASIKMAFKLYEANLKQQSALKELQRATEKLRTAGSCDTLAERIELTMEAASVAWWEMDIATGNVNFARQKTDMLGYSTNEFTNYRDFTRLVHPDDYGNTMKAMHDHFTGIKEKYETEYRIRARSGEYKWFYDVRSINERDRNGTPLKVAGIVLDITERKLADKKILTLLSEKDLILKEVHHRIKNNMNTIYGLLIIQANSMSNPSAAEALNDAGKRVKSMQLLYDKLYRSTNHSRLPVNDYFSPLLDEILSNFPDSGSVTVEKKIADFTLEAAVLQPLGIIINELLTNSMKHAFDSVSDRRIIFSAAIDGDRVTIRIADNGAGIPGSVDFATSTGFGLKLVSGLVKQLDGTVRIERTTGTGIVIELKK